MQIYGHISAVFGHWVYFGLSSNRKLAAAKLPPINNVKMMDILSEEAALLYLSPFSVGVNSYRKEFAPRSKFFPARVDPISKSYYFIQRSEQEFIQVNIALFS